MKFSAGASVSSAPVAPEGIEEEEMSFVKNSRPYKLLVKAL